MYIYTYTNNRRIYNKKKILWQGRSQKKRNKSTTYNHKER